MDTAIQNYTVQPVMIAVQPGSSPYLNNATSIDARYIANNQRLNITLSFTLPGDIDPSLVTIQQFYDPGVSNTLQFYIVYNSNSTDTLKPIPCAFKASELDGAGSPIDMGGITRISIMVVNSYGPKTSRGITSNVRVTGC